MKRFKNEKGFNKRKNNRKKYRCKRKKSLFNKSDSFRKKLKLDQNNKFNISVLGYWRR